MHAVGDDSVLTSRTHSAGGCGRVALGFLQNATKFFMIIILLSKVPVSATGDKTIHAIHTNNHLLTLNSEAMFSQV